jgi:hypothetical protein
MAAPAYLFPATLSATVAPTAVQVANRVVASISGVTAAGDVQIVHNMGLTVAQIAMGAPIVNVEPVTAEARVVRWIVSAQSANGTTLTQLSGNATATAAIVTIRRPHTIGS